MGLVVDNSGSMYRKRPSVNKSALDLIEASNPQDEAFVVNFSDEAFIDCEFTSDIKKLRDGLSHIDSRGGTALYDAVAASADKLAADAKRPKQVLILITDGEDNASSLDLEQTIHRVQQLSGPVIYSIGLLFGPEMTRAEVRHARRALEMLSQETGGLAFFPKSIDQVDQIAAEVARDIRSQYTIGYHSTKPISVPGFRKVDVTAESKGDGKLTVRTRTGYFPTPTAGRQGCSGESREPMADETERECATEATGAPESDGREGLRRHVRGPFPERRDRLLQRCQGVLSTTPSGWRGGWGWRRRPQRSKSGWRTSRRCFGASSREAWPRRGHRK